MATGAAAGLALSALVVYDLLGGGWREVGCSAAFGWCCWRSRTAAWRAGAPRRDGGPGARAEARLTAHATARAPAADLESAIDDLYQLPLEAFVAERNALATAVRKAGDRAAADRVKALAKPSATAWAVNQAWWTRARHVRRDALGRRGDA